MTVKGWFLFDLLPRAKINKMQYSFGLLLFVALLFGGCAEPTPEVLRNTGEVTRLEVPDTTVEKSALRQNAKRTIWVLGAHPYSGFIESYYPDGSLMERFGVVDGVKQGAFLQWYADGHYKNIANYHQGKLQGEKKAWSSDDAHVLIAHFNFKKGRADGAQTKWYPSGELYKKMNMKMGKEEGLQQAFRKNGDLYANYEAREGRIFGLKKAALCYGLEGENVQYGN